MNENGAITWTNETRKLCDLVPWENNPREIFKDESERLGESLDTFGQVELLAIGPDNDLYNGHQRKLVWSLLPKYGPDYEVDVRVASRPLTEHEKEQLTVFLHRGTNARWDWDKLATFEVPDLLDWGFSEDELQLNWGEDEQQKDLYSRKIESPVYEPSNVKPRIGELLDDSKTRALVAAIDAVEGLTEDERAFLIVAARRHTVLHFGKIADYYAHADEELQKLMEDSALVIIDFDRAIELGYVRLADGIAEQYRADYGDD